MLPVKTIVLIGQKASKWSFLSSWSCHACLCTQPDHVPTKLWKPTGKGLGLGCTALLRCMMCSTGFSCPSDKIVPFFPDAKNSPKAKVQPPALWHEICSSVGEAMAASMEGFLSSWKDWEVFKAKRRSLWGR